MKVVIIGGVAGGASAATRLRRLDEGAEIVMLERGAFVSFANCGLPYHIGGAIEDESDLVLQTPNSLKRRFNIDVRVRSEAVAIDRAAKMVRVLNLSDRTTYDESYDALILSPGAVPIKPPLPGIEDERVFTLRNIPDTLAIRSAVDELRPKRAVVVGGGYIGLEMAENLLALGIGVTIAEMASHVVAPLDSDVAADVHHYLRAKGVTLHLCTAVLEIKPTTNSLMVRTTAGDLPADLVILAAGVRPDTRIAREAGLETNEKGAIRVDARMRTSDAAIYAVGDAVETFNFVTGEPACIPLAGPANRQGRLAADAICGRTVEYKGTQGSAILKFMEMTVGATGLSESAARGAGIDCEKVYTHSSSHASYYPGATMMSVKCVFEKPSGRLLGAQIVGFDGVDKRLDVLATAIRARMTMDDLAELELCYAPSFSSAKDPVNIAGFAAQNVLTGVVKQFHWHDVTALHEDKNAVLLDVRTPGEFGRGHIRGALNIPIDELRVRMGELDARKPHYINCQSGFRSYLACRILSHAGFECFNLAGGYRLYQAVTSDAQVK